MNAKTPEARNRGVAIAMACLLGIASIACAESGVKGPSGTLHVTEVTTKREPLAAGCRYQLWIPADVSVVRSLFVINMRAAGKRLFFYDPEWRAMAARHAAAMLYCEFEAKGVRDNGYGRSMLRACEQFASALQRPELKHAPFVLWGHSMGGRVAQDFVRYCPSRVLAFHIALRAHPTPEDLMHEEAAAMRVPGLYLMGAEDGKPKDIRAHFHRARHKGSPRAWVWLPGQTHWPRGMGFTHDQTTDEDWRAWAAHDVVVPWTEAMIQLRLPEDADPRTGPVQLASVDATRGWLGDVSTGEVATHAQFDGDQSKASWFPNEEVAQAWSRFSYPAPR
ncbi:MAG: hypothetical protein AAGD07_09040 [Planctomycetota bacterium]